MNTYAIPRAAPLPRLTIWVIPEISPLRGWCPRTTIFTSNYPLPQGWSVAFDPPSPELAPDEEQTVHVVVTPPDGFTGRQPLNVNAFNRYGLAGGLTLYLERE